MTPATDVSAPPAAAPPGRPRPTPLLWRALDRFDALGVRWSVLRGAGTGGTPCDEVDVLVHPADLPTAEAVLVGLRAVRVGGPGRGSHRKHVVPDPGSGRAVAVDLVTEVAFGRYAEHPTKCAEHVLERSVADGRLRRPAPADRFWLLVLHGGLDGAELSAETRRDLERCAQDPEVLASPLAPAAGRLLATTLSAADVVAHVGGGAGVGDLQWRRPRTRSRVLASTRRLVRRLARPRQRRRRGLLVAVLGPDGAGKSSLLGSPPSWPFPVTCWYAGLYPAGTPARRFPGRLRRYRRTHRDARRAARAGHLVLLDRHPYDVLVLADGRPSAKRRAQRWLTIIACPPPDLFVVLDAPGTTLFGRAGEHDPQTLERQRAAYGRLVRLLPAWRRAPIVTLDATRPPAEVSAALTYHLWQHLWTRQGGRVSLRRV